MHGCSGFWFRVYKVEGSGFTGLEVQGLGFILTDPPSDFKTTVAALANDSRGVLDIAVIKWRQHPTDRASDLDAVDVQVP